MKSYKEMTKTELEELKVKLDAEYKDAQSKGLKLDMSRGKPSKTQLDLSKDMLDVITSESDMVCESGVDVRNYGILDGIPEAKKLMNHCARCWKVDEKRGYVLWCALLIEMLHARQNFLKKMWRN